MASLPMSKCTAPNSGLSCQTVVSATPNSRCSHASCTWSPSRIPQQLQPQLVGRALASRVLHSRVSASRVLDLHRVSAIRVSTSRGSAASEFVGAAGRCSVLKRGRGGGVAESSSMQRHCNSGSRSALFRRDQQRASAAAGGGGRSRDGADEAEETKGAEETKEAEATNEAEHKRQTGGVNLQVLVAALLTTIFGVSNRVLYKLALVPLKNYPFFLAQLTTASYVAIYFLILLLRYRAGIVTPAMLSLPKRWFAAIGLLDALGLASGMAAAAVLPGAIIPILGQSFLLWQILLSAVILKKQFSVPQIIGASLVIFGVITVVTSGSSAASPSLLASVGFFWPFVLVVSCIFPALSSIIKESLFKKAAQTLPNKQLDIFVVNSFGSGFQALFVLLLLPFLSWVGFKIPFNELPTYFQEGSACLLNPTGSIVGCEGAPLLPLLYVMANMAFNVSALNLLRISSAIVASLSITLSLPLTIIAFTLPLPLVGQPQALSPRFFVGTGVLILGLALYNIASARRNSGKLKEA